MLSCIIDGKMTGHYDMDLGRIAYVGKQGVLCLLSESTFSEHSGHTSPSHRLEDFFKDIVNKYNERLLYLVLPTHLYTIQDIFNSALNKHRKIVLMGKKLQNVVTFAKREGYLSFPDDLLGDLSNIEEKDEKLLVKIENELSMFGCRILSIPKEKNILHHASQEDLLLMLKLMSPKYYMPVKGEYRYLVGNADLASSLGMPNENIILKQNGDVVVFEDGVLKESTEHIKVNDILIDGKSSDDVGELVIKDREMLSENGIVLISATISKKTKTLLVGPEVTTRGFIYVKDSKEIIYEIKRISEEVITRNIVDNFVDFNKIKTEIRTELSKFLYEETECKPMIIAVVQEV